MNMKVVIIHQSGELSGVGDLEDWMSSLVSSSDESGVLACTCALSCESGGIGPGSLLGEYLSWVAAASHRHWDTIATLDIPIVPRSSNHAGNFNTARDKTQGSRPVIDSVNSLVEGTDAIVRQPYHHPVRRNPHSAIAKIL